jgi:hypothetical protein
VRHNFGDHEKTGSLNSQASIEALGPTLETRDLNQGRALDTRVELPNRDAEHPKDAPLLASAQSSTSIAEKVASVLSSLSKRSEHSTTLVRLGLSAVKDHLSPPANGPKNTYNTRYMYVHCSAIDRF